jgi:hypothetical protein
MTMTYNSLSNQILSYSLRKNDPDTIAQIPNFINQAEQRIARESKNVGLEVYVSGSFISNSSVLAKPARWRRNISFNYGTGEENNDRNPILLRSYEFVRNYWPNDTKTGTPKFYSDYGYGHLLIAPTPDQAYPFEYTYLEIPESLSENNQTNWLTNFVPDVLLYASLLEAIPFLQNDERIGVWQSMYDRALSSLNGQDDQRISDRMSRRTAD